MVSESEKTPAVGLSESLAVFNHYVEAVAKDIFPFRDEWLTAARLPGPQPFASHLLMKSTLAANPRTFGRA